MRNRYDYFQSLVKMTEYACDAARYFDGVINSFDPAEISSRMAEMHLIEHAADEQRHEIMNTLARDFLPPIEQEDISGLASMIDDVIDCIDDIMQHLFIYDVKELLPECKIISALMLKICESLNNIAKEFSNYKKSSAIHKDIISTNDIESQADRIYAETMHRIFTSDMSVKEIMIWERLITSFEDCFDYCEDAAGLFESAVMKNS